MYIILNSTILVVICMYLLLPNSSACVCAHTAMYVHIREWPDVSGYSASFSQHPSLPLSPLPLSVNGRPHHTSRGIPSNTRHTVTDIHLPSQRPWLLCPAPSLVGCPHSLYDSEGCRTYFARCLSSLWAEDGWNSRETRRATTTSEEGTMWRRRFARPCQSCGRNGAKLGHCQLKNDPWHPISHL